MKNSAYWWLILISAVLIAFTLGFFIGRNTSSSNIEISDFPQATTSATTASEPTSASEPAKVNINTADAEQLQTLPGIGPVLAQRIISYRQENGAFRSVTELANVSGIGQSILEEILDLITVGG